MGAAVVFAGPKVAMPSGGDVLRVSVVWVVPTPIVKLPGARQFGSCRTLYSATVMAG